jgi:hypothetical protein
MMIRSWKRKWVKALKSGDFKQCKGKLKHIGRYCCLGVLGEVINHGSLNFGTKDREDLTGLSYNEQKELARLNDSGKTFKEIASYIIKNL